jgi:hypothetical protein
MLPMRPGQVERRTYDYTRHGTTTLFAALEIATGKVTDACKPRHRHTESPRRSAFLRPITQNTRNSARSRHSRVISVLRFKVATATIS